MPKCQKRLKAEGLRYPRTCPVCGLFGRCRYLVDDALETRQADPNELEAAETKQKETQPDNGGIQSRGPNQTGEEG
jgi:hypothetical protein